MKEFDEDALVADPSSAREVLRIDKPQFNHNGGVVMFGPDRMMYLSLGDGGASNYFGVGHAPAGNAQTLVAGNVLGKILRIVLEGRRLGLDFLDSEPRNAGSLEPFATYGREAPGRRLRLSFLL